MTLKVKIAQYIDVTVKEGATEDEMYAAIDTHLKDPVNRGNMDFCIESVNDDDMHPLVDEMVG